MSEKSTLFKDKIILTDYEKMTEALLAAISVNDENALKNFLFGSTALEEYTAHGKYREGQHNRCSGFTADSAPGRYTEKRECKCLYYRNGKYYRAEKCNNCIFKDEFRLKGNFTIADYEVPAFYYGKNIGEIDLIISDGINLYATEAKPVAGNDETLLRMIAEIITYTAGYPKDKYKKAIVFFENTSQEKEYKSLKDSSGIKRLIKAADITVFQFRKDEEGCYTLCKL